jgi:hypothetical protein
LTIKNTLFLVVLVPFISFVQWDQLGRDIDDDPEEDRFGRSLSLDAAGDTMIVGAEANNANGKLSGLSRKWCSLGTAWKHY